MRRWLVPVLALVLLLTLAQPALAQEGAGDRVIFDGIFTLRAGEQFYGDVTVFGGSVTVEEDAAVHGSVTAFGGAVRIAGGVDGDIVAFGGRVDVEESATVQGRVTSIGGAVVDRRVQVDGDIGGQAERVSPSREPWGPRAYSPGYDAGWSTPWRRAVNELMRLVVWVLQTGFILLTMVALAAVVTSLSPGVVDTASRALTTYPAESIAAGLLAGLAAVVAIVVLTVTCLGLPVAVVLALGLPLALLLGWIVAGRVVGERLLAALNRPQAEPVVSAVVGVFVLTLLARLPGLGFLVMLLAGAWGLGAVMLTRFGTAPFQGSLSHSPSGTPPEA